MSDASPVVWMPAGWGRALSVSLHVKASRMVFSSGRFPSKTSTASHESQTMVVEVCDVERVKRETMSIARGFGRRVPANRALKFD